MLRFDLEKIEKALKESKEQFGLKENQIKENVDSLTVGRISSQQFQERVRITEY